MGFLCRLDGSFRALHENAARAVLRCSCQRAVAASAPHPRPFSHTWQKGGRRAIPWCRVKRSFLGRAWERRPRRSAAHLLPSWIAVWNGQILKIELEMVGIEAGCAGQYCLHEHNAHFRLSRTECSSIHRLCCCVAVKIKANNSAYGVRVGPSAHTHMLSCAVKRSAACGVSPLCAYKWVKQTNPSKIPLLLKHS